MPETCVGARTQNRNQSTRFGCYAEATYTVWSDDRYRNVCEKHVMAAIRELMNETGWNTVEVEKMPK